MTAATLTPPPQPRTVGARRLRQRLPRPGQTVAVAVVWVAVLALHVVAAWPAHGPVWTDDEIGVLANARLLSGNGVLELAHQSYYPGWSVLLIPVWWVTSDPVQVYRAAVLLSAVCATLLLAPLTALARRIGLTLVPATLVAATVAVAPGRVTYSTTALTENFLALCVALVAVAGVRYARRRTTGAAVLLGVSAGWVFVVHGRMVALLAMTLVWLVVEGARRGRGAGRAGWAGAAAALAVAVPGYALHGWVSGELYADASRESVAIGNLVDWSVGSLAWVGAGQLWYLAVSWVMLAVLGAVLVLVLVRRETRLRRPDLGWWALGIVVGTSAISVLTMATLRTKGSGRLDVLSYGRYLEPLLVVLSTVGLAYVLRRPAPRRRLVLGALLATVAVCLVFVPWTLAEADRTAWWGVINVPSLLGLVAAGAGELPWVAASVVAVAFGGALLVVRKSRRARAVWAGVLALYLVVSSVVALNGLVWEFNRSNGREPGLLAAIHALADEPIAYDSAGADWTSQNSFQYWTGDREVQVFDSEVEAPPTDLVIARSSWPRGEELGAVAVAASDRNESLWVMPGALADELTARGAVVPEDPTEPLAGFSGTAERIDADADDLIPSDGASIVVRLANTGASSWEPLGAFPDAAGSVRVVLWWTLEDGTTAPQLADLRGSVLPGATIDVWIDLEPPADAAGGLVSLTLVQEGVAELTPPGEPLLELSYQGR